MSNILSVLRQKWSGRLVQKTKGITSFRIVFFVHTPSLREQSLFYKRLAMMLEAGVPLRSALTLLSSEEKVPHTRNILMQIVSTIEAGVSLSQALIRHQYPLLPLSRHIIEVGETSGTLALNLSYVARLLKDRLALRTQIRQALVYPAIILLATLGIALFLVVGILPKIIPIFASMQSELPLSTRFLLSVSYGISHYWYVGLGLLLILSLGIAYIVRIPNIRRFLHKLILKLPIFSKLITTYTVAMTCQMLGILLESNVRIGNALRIISHSSTSTVYESAWTEIVARVEQGQRLSLALRTYPNLFPATLVHMVEAGETTGSLRESLRYLADMYENDLRDMTKSLTALLEPLLMLVMGLVVGFIAIAIITPIYGITEHLHK